VRKIEKVEQRRPGTDADLRRPLADREGDHAPAAGRDCLGGSGTRSMLRGLGAEDRAHGA
jgi:hypothetical protein